MKRLALAALAMLAGTALLAANLDALLLFHFDPARVSPAEAGEPRLAEAELDGLVLWVAPPEAGRPVVFYLPGNAGNLAQRAPHFSRFLDNGYGLVALGYPGSSGSTGTETAAGLQAAAEQVFQALPTLAGSGAAPPPGIVLYGESLGTGIAVELAARHPVAGLVLEAPYTSILDVARHLHPRLAPYLPAALERWPSRRRITAVTAPLLVLHGGRDRLIPPEMGRALYARAGSEIKELHIEPDAGHTDIWRAQARAALFAFLERL